MNRGKVKTTDEIELRSGERIREMEEDEYKCLGIWQSKRTGMSIQEDKIDFKE